MIDRCERLPAHGQTRRGSVDQAHACALLARRAIALEDEVKEIDTTLKALVADTAPELVAVDGVGTDVASALFVAAGDNPDA